MLLIGEVRCGFSIYIYSTVHTLHWEGPANWILGVRPPNLIKYIAFLFFFFVYSDQPYAIILSPPERLDYGCWRDTHGNVGGAFSLVGRTVREGVSDRLSDSLRLTTTRPDPALTVCSSTR